MRPTTATTKRTTRYESPGAIRGGFEAHYLAAVGSYLLPERPKEWGNPIFVCSGADGCTVIAPDGRRFELDEGGALMLVYWPSGWTVFRSAPTDKSFGIEAEARAAGLEDDETQGAAEARRAHNPTGEGSTPSPATTSEALDVGDVGDDLAATITAEDLVGEPAEEQPPPPPKPKAKPGRKKRTTKKKT